MKHASDFTMHNRLLAGERLAIDANEPWHGCYRIRMRAGGAYLPIVYWPDSYTGMRRCQLDGKDISDQRALELWPYAAKNPVSAADYQEHKRTGKWPGESAAVIGHNLAPPDDDIDAIGERINDLGREAEHLIDRGAALTQATCDQASDLANTLGELEAKCKSLHQAEKAPHLAAGREVDRKWNPVRDLAAIWKTKLKRIVITPYLNRLEEEATKRDIVTEQQPIRAGAAKRTTALRTVTKAEVTDWHVLFTALIDNEQMRELAQQIANSAARSGVALHGCKIIKTREAA